ncbi:complement component C8 alpha chain isoform X1 [Silurus asotus]|uniref:Complement component C8 alpha chain isoform X1 n=1 Tax=Silurus asotus TaxID=30991 RepID=A0AAD5AIM3_SILAS|nr:complement component C8 alpha chain isoform X1 [Silurus asotus]
MRALRPWKDFITILAESAGFYWSSPHNRTNVFLRRTRDASSPIPIECKMRSWTSWTPCDSCTERSVRFQYVERHSQFGGTPCVLSQWDEKRCPVQGECVPQDKCGDMYACPETGRCIGKHLLCNGDLDCALGSDEDDCETIKTPETKCTNMFPIPGAEKAIQGYNVLGDVFVNPVLDARYFGGICEYIYNGEWRELTYDSFCEQLYYNDDEKYFRKPYNFLSYRMLAHSLSQGATEEYSDAESLITGKQTEHSSNFGVTGGVMYVEVGVSASHAKNVTEKLTEFKSKDVQLIRLVSTVETAQFKMKSRDLMLHEDMLMSLMELPEQYNFGAYSNFIKEYGTHYVTEGVLGGILDYIVVIDTQVMKREKLRSWDVRNCLGLSLGISGTITPGLEGELKVSHETCKPVGHFTKESQEKNPMIRDAFGYVKGGITGPSAGQLAVRDANSYRAWGKSLKHNPAVIKFEALPIYELVRFSTAASQARTRIPLLKQAWAEYMQQFNPCHCAPCENNGMPVLSKTSCSCVCKAGCEGLACEKTEREAIPIHGAWSCWSSWSSCVSGTQRRTRECNNPAPKYNGFQCRGNPSQTKRC